MKPGGSYDRSHVTRRSRPPARLLWFASSPATENSSAPRPSADRRSPISRARRDGGGNGFFEFAHGDEFHAENEAWTASIATWRARRARDCSSPCGRECSTRRSSPRWRRRRRISSRGGCASTSSPAPIPPRTRCTVTWRATPTLRPHARVHRHPARALGAANRSITRPTATRSAARSSARPSTADADLLRRTQRGRAAHRRGAGRRVSRLG